MIVAERGATITVRLRGWAMTTGMEGFAAGAGALAGRAQGLRAAVDSGQLVMDAEAAERVAKVYEDKAESLGDLISDSQRLVRRSVYGDCRIGSQLEQKFNEKVNGASGSPDAGLTPILRRMEQTLRSMAQAYRDAARDTQSNDEEQARQLGRSI
ncbi:hypothetical protein [Saccharopolyspora sp. CA-218241]|uniref:hypothetical protein n=1 Tax=Saccharopolyspora sp. CA-218241 TaxID=3240027 RepID=UPI003D970858